MDDSSFRPRVRESDDDEPLAERVEQYAQARGIVASRAYRDLLEAGLKVKGPVSDEEIEALRNAIREQREEVRAYLAEQGVIDEDISIKEAYSDGGN